MTVFLDARTATPFYGGTYFPPSDRHGLPGFPRLLGALADAWANRRGEVAAVGSRSSTESLGTVRTAPARDHAPHATRS